MYIWLLEYALAYNFDYKSKENIARKENYTPNNKIDSKVDDYYASSTD